MKERSMSVYLKTYQGFKIAIYRKQRCAQGTRGGRLQLGPHNGRVLSGGDNSRSVPVGTLD